MYKSSNGILKNICKWLEMIRIYFFWFSAKKIYIFHVRWNALGGRGQNINFIGKMAHILLSIRPFKKHIHSPSLLREKEKIWKGRSDNFPRSLIQAFQNFVYIWRGTPGDEANVPATKLLFTYRISTSWGILNLD